MSIQIGVFTSDISLLNKIETVLIKNTADLTIKVKKLSNYKETTDYINFEFPEFLIIRFSNDDPDSINILKQINDDPWLHSIGILIILDKKHSTIPKELNKSNIISIVDDSEVNFFLSRILNILLLNKNISIKKDVYTTFFNKHSGQFILNNDISLIASYVNILLSSIIAERYLTVNKSNGLKIALTELLTNAIEHGNCEINYDEKTKFLEECKDINDLIKEKNNIKRISDRKVKLTYSFTDEELSFIIEDEGNGFNHSDAVFDPENEEDILKNHGRGIFLTRMYVDSLEYNKKGNKVTLKVKTEKNIKNFIPQGFSDEKEINVSKGDLIFKQGEESTSLYYIVNGIYDVIVNNKIIAELSSNDIFLGEMSFLLNNTRVATIKAKTTGKLIQISKKVFVSVIKKYPHYGLFIAKLLAKRLEKTNLNTIKDSIENTIKDNNLEE